MILWFLEKAEVVAYASESIRSATHTFQLPSVVRLRQYVKHRIPEKAPFVRENVFLRDQFSCQYCGLTLPSKKLTLDHVLPLSKGGAHAWENVVTACSPCNNKKGDRTPEVAAMPLKNKPKPLKSLSPESILSAHLNSQHIPEIWLEYLALKAS